MASNADRAQRWIDRALGRTDRDLGTNGTVYYVGDTIYSYGHHFEMATIMRNKHDRPSFVLANGDTYSVTTAGHQSLMRGVVAGSGLPTITVPFSALRVAGINHASIRPLDIRPPRSEERAHTSQEAPGTEQAVTWDSATKEYVRSPNAVYVGRSSHVARLGEDGLYHWTTYRHWLGDSVFEAKVRGRRRRFLSSFDYQEARPLYFLAELPRGCKAETVPEALEALRGPLVRAADDAGIEVTRQGDVFAIPAGLSTRELKKLAGKGSRIVKRGKVAETDHAATDVIYGRAGRTYVRGTMYHDSFTQDHARRRIGDGRTWHIIERNTVPRQNRTRTRIR